MLNLLVTVVWMKEIAMAQQVAVKVLMNTLDGLGAPVLKYHAHIFHITRKKKKKTLLELNNQHGKHG